MAEFETLISSAELLILHAGAGSVIHAVRAGKVPVLMPRRAQFGELIDDHQTEFARALEASGRVIVINDPSQLGKAVQRALEVQREMVVNSKVSRMTRLIEGTLARYATLSR